MSSRHTNRHIPESNTSSRRDVLRASDLDQELVILDRNGRVTVAERRLAELVASLLVVQEGGVVVSAPAGGGGSGKFRNEDSSGMVPSTAGGRAPGLVPISRPRAGRQAASEEAGLIFEGAGSYGAVPDPELEDRTYLKDDGTWSPITKADIVDLENVSVTPAPDSIPKSDGAGHLDDDWFADGGIALDKLASPGAAYVFRTTLVGALVPVQMTAQTLLARKDALDQVAPHTVAAQSVVGRAAGDIANLAAAADSVLARLGSGNLGFAAAAVSSWFGRLASGNLGFQTMADLASELGTLLGSTSRRVVAGATATIGSTYSRVVAEDFTVEEGGELVIEEGGILMVIA